MQSSVLGHRQVVEYLYRDTAWIEGLGWATRKFSLKEI
ncbi:DNA circularization N-terminal domain-containing protein [Xenorhabdus bovienii]|nr:DNA circularization N-terminal domain-containing protein [Xenorhabdus bovienii]